MATASATTPAASETPQEREFVSLPVPQSKKVHVYIEQNDQGICIMCNSPDLAEPEPLLVIGSGGMWRPPVSSMLASMAAVRSDYSQYKVVANRHEVNSARSAFVTTEEEMNASDDDNKVEFALCQNSAGQVELHAVSQGEHNIMGELSYVDGNIVFDRQALSDGFNRAARNAARRLTVRT